MKVSIFDNRSQLDPHPLNTSRGYLFGDGFFTTGIVEKGTLLHFQQHKARLEYAASKLLFKGFCGEKLFAQLKPVLSSVDSAAVRISVSREQLSRGYAFETNANPQVCVQLSSITDEPAQPCELKFATTPISSNPMLAGLKHLNRLDNVLAAQEVQHPFQEVLLCLEQYVICGSRSNLFIYKNNRWLTPRLTRAGINGITRQRLLESMQKNGIKVEDCDINKHQVVECEAAFITNSLVGLWPAKKIMDTTLATELSEELKITLKFTR